MLQVKELKNEFSRNENRNYVIKKEIEDLLKEEFGDKPINVAKITGSPRVSVGGIYYNWDECCKNLYVEWSPSCYQGTTENGLLEFNREKVRRLEEWVNVGQRLYEIFSGRRLLPEEFNLLEILNNLKEGK